MSPQHLSLDEAVATFRPVDSLGLPLGPGQPVALIHALGARTDWEHFEVVGAMLVDFYELFDRPGVHLSSLFYGPAERIYRDAGASIDFIPADFRRFAPVMQSRCPRVMATVATPPDADGWMSLSVHAGATVDELHRAGADAARTLIVETNAHFPRTLGISDEHPHRLHADEADIIVVSDRLPVELTDPPVGDVERAIAAHALTFIHDGSTLQTGFGAVPSTIASILAEGAGGGYGVHSEMFTTGLMRLHQAGKVTTEHKNRFVGFSIATVAAGTAELYRWLDGRDDVRFAPVSVVNDPDLIAANRRLVTINGAIAVDLWGQITADTIGVHQFSGIGGHEDFVSAAGLELEDRSLVCLPSTTVVGGVTISRIVTGFSAGAIVTTPRHQVDVVITEYGAAELRGLATRDRARALAAVAHPDFRDELLASVDQRT